MTLKHYHGSCHCGTVRYEVDLDLAQGTNRCNCSLCTKARAWFAFVKPEQFRLIAADAAQTEYRWTPPTRPEPFLHFHFCKTCGIRTHAWGEAESFGGRFYALAISTLDGVDPDELAAAPLRFIDGRNDRFDHAPVDTRLL